MNSVKLTMICDESHAQDTWRGVSWALAFPETGVKGTRRLDRRLGNVQQYRCGETSIHHLGVETV